jgi:hypothetical protein
MNRGILFAILAALVIGLTTSACRRATDPRQLAMVDSLIADMEAAHLTLNELDVQHYRKADSILGASRPLFLRRFSDTLDRATAMVLGRQFVHLRHAGQWAEEHERTRSLVEGTLLRLQRLRNDLDRQALKADDATDAVALERKATVALDTLVHRTLANYRTTQRVLVQQAHVDSLLAGNVTIPNER